MRRAELTVCVLIALALPPAALAHANLIRSVPPVGASVASSPPEVRLVFDDGVRVAPGVAAVRNGGASVLGGRARASGRVETIPLRAHLGNGVYTVRWSIVSDDGHLIQGVVPFRVGAGGTVSAGLGVQGTSRPADVAARWGFLLGVLLAGGVAIFRLAVGRSGRDGLLLAAGFALVVAGGAASLALQPTTGTRYALALEVGIGVAAAGLALVRTRLAVAAALGLLAVPTISGHALDPSRSWAQVPDDLVHVAAASAWVGGLAALALARELVRRFSRLALPAVLALAATGGVRALSELAAFHQLWTTGYGRALLVKTGLLAALLGLGFANRRRLVRGLLGVELALLVVLVAAVGFLTDSRPGRRAQALAAPAAAGEAPLPPRDALVLAREDGPWAVALAVRGREATVTVIDADGNGVDALGASIAAAAASPCGHGCYRAALPSRPRRLTVTLGGTQVAFNVPGRAPPARPLALRATRAFRSLRSVAFTERLASGAGAAITTRWIEQAPNRLSYRIAGGPEAVVIGGRRWDRSPGGRWQATPAEPLELPTPPWTEISNARLIGTTPRTWTVAFLDRSIPAWFEVTIDRRTSLPLATRMTATAHFMRHVYGRFNSAPPVTPPPR